MASVRQYFDDPRLAGLDFSDSWLRGFVFEDGLAIRLFCDFHLTRDHPEWQPFDDKEFWACYWRGSIVFRGCKDVVLKTGSIFPRATDHFDCDTMDTFEIHDALVKVETGSLKFEIHTTDFAVELDKVIN
jgi:hypothetical protein